MDWEFEGNGKSREGNYHPRCELTDLLITECAHCRKETLGDEEDTKHGQFDGLMKGKRNVSS